MRFKIFDWIRISIWVRKNLHGKKNGSSEFSLYITYKMTKSFFYIGCHIDTLVLCQSQMRSLSNTMGCVGLKNIMWYHHGYLYIRKSDNNPTILLFEILALNGARNMDITEWSKLDQSIAICSLSREFKTRKHNSNSV